MAQTTSTNIPAWKTRWNEIRNQEIEKARILAKTYAEKCFCDANTIIFALLHDNTQPAIQLTDKAFFVFTFDDDSYPLKNYPFQAIAPLCPDAKAEFLRIFHILLTREYGEGIELNKLFKLEPDPIISDYTPE